MQDLIKWYEDMLTEYEALDRSVRLRLPDEILDMLSWAKIQIESKIIELKILDERIKKDETKSDSK